MKVKITYADYSEPRFKEINTLDELLYLTKEENRDIIIQQQEIITEVGINLLMGKQMIWLFLAEY